MSAVTTPAFCDSCGRGRAPDDAPHAHCDTARGLEPPRYCVQCGRRLVVQVLPRGWTARCAVHGELAP